MSRPRSLRARAHSDREQWLGYGCETVPVTRLTIAVMRRGCHHQVGRETRHKPDEHPPVVQIFATSLLCR
jgi:hypothetical protein